MLSDTPSLYLTPPTGEAELKQVELECLARVELLNRIHVELDAVEFERDAWPKIISALVDSGFHADPAGDNASHYMLRHALCRRRESVQWFVKAESALFRARVRTLSRQAVTELGMRLISQCDIPFRVVVFQALSDDARGLLCDAAAANFKDQSALSADEPVYVLPFRFAAAAFANCTSPLLRGECLVRGSELWRIVVSRFPLLLEEGVASCKRAIEKYGKMEDRRVAHFDVLISAESTAFAQDEARKAAGQALAVEDIEDLGKNKSTPLCIQHLMHEAKTPDRLKHNDRRTLVLFLRDAGVVLSDAIRFMRHALDGKGVTGFTRSDEYQVRYEYGRAGRNRQSPAKWCSALIADARDASLRGCPFAKLDDKSLVSYLRRRALTQPQVDAVMKQRSDNNFRGACSCVFGFTHKIPAPKIVISPQDYFKDSRLLLSQASQKEQ